MLRENLEIKKNVQHIMYHKCYYPNYDRPIKGIRLIKKLVNPIDLVSIPPDHPLEQKISFQPQRGIEYII